MSPFKSSKFHKTKPIASPSTAPGSALLLYNTANYNSTIKAPIADIVGRYADLLIEYIGVIGEKLKMKNASHHAFMFIKGLETLTHVFKMILFYTKNLDLTAHHSQKAYLFFIEFIEQISDDSVTFLNLSCRDAVLFVYKKTIYDINNDYKKKLVNPSAAEGELFGQFDEHSRFYSSIIAWFVRNPYPKFESQKDKLVYGAERVCALREFVKGYGARTYKSHITYANQLIDLLMSRGISPEANVFENVEQIVRKIYAHKKLSRAMMRDMIADTYAINVETDEQMIGICESIVDGSVHVPVPVQVPIMAK